jgi:DNA polymerase/3'-5' exonuclease PolX
MNIYEYIGKGAVLQRLQNQLTTRGLAEFNTLADQYPELQKELVYAYSLLTEIAGSYPPEEVVSRFREAYMGHLEKVRAATQEARLPLTDVKDVSGRYRVHPKSHVILFYSYLVFLAIVVSLTIYFYLRMRA